jgi:tetratricopeptide (TPR) repeat protein
VRPSQALVLALLTGFPAAGCAHGRAKPAATAPAPTSLGNLDAFATTLNRFALLESTDPARPGYRAALLGFLAGHFEEAIREGKHEEASTSLEYAVALWRPAELRQRAAQPRLARMAQQLYAFAARRGSERPALLALAIRMHFGSDTARDDAMRSWEQIEEWIVRNGAFEGEPVLRHEELERSLEEVAAVFPSAFVTRRLADLYAARFEAARQAISRGEFGAAAVRRVEFSGYLVLRAYLRADDVEGGDAALARLAVDAPTRRLRALVAEAARPARSARPLLALAEQFRPAADEEHLPEVYRSQGWAIVGNLARRAVAAHPRDPWARITLARALTQEGVIDAAIHHLEAAIAAKEDVFEAWAELAVLHQESLARLARSDAGAAKSRLASLERFHRRATQLWPDRPLHPGLPEAYHSVADGLYHAGLVGEASELLERSLALEPVPVTLDLLATIALKRGNLSAARTHYEALAALPFRDEAVRLRWEARALVQLAEVARRERRTDAAAEHLRAATRQLGALVRDPRIAPSERAEHLVERGKALVALGDVGLGVADFQSAADLAPDEAAVYSDPLLFLVARGYYAQALTVYRRANRERGVEPTTHLYFCLWLYELARRCGIEPDPGVVAFLQAYRGDAWPRRLADHALGALPYASLLAAAATNGERTEARFYESLRRWDAGDSDGGRALLREVVASDLMGFFEYEMAQSYLQANELPRQQPATAQVPP